MMSKQANASGNLLMSLQSLSPLQTTVSFCKRNLSLAVISACTTLAWIAVAAIAFAVTSCMTGCAPADSLSNSRTSGDDYSSTYSDEQFDEQFSVNMPSTLGGQQDSGNSLAAGISPPQLAEATTSNVRSVSVRLTQRAGKPESNSAEAFKEQTNTDFAVDDDSLSDEMLNFVSQTDDVPAMEVEIIPTPEGTPESEDAIREAKLARALEMERKSAQPKPAEPQPANPTPALAEAENAEPKSDPAQSKPNDEMAAAEPETYKTWDPPTLTLVLTGNQHGYIEPCGCTGLTRQKGGVARRYTFLDTLEEKGWPIVPMDVGNQVRRFGRQATIKLQQSVRALTEMDYQAVGFGPEDIRLGVGDLLAVAASDSPEDSLYVSANVVLFDPEFLPQVKVVESNGIKVGVTSIMDPEKLTVDPGDEVIVSEMVPAASAAIKALTAKSPDFKVLLFYGKEESAEKLVREVPGFDLVVVAGGYGEPTYQPAAINDSDTKMILTGAKGMYAGLIGLYENPKKPTMKYARVALSHEFADAPEMRGLMKDYQDQLKSVGLEGLGLLPAIPHSSGNKFVGTATCGKCHTEALEIWEGTPHAFATDSIVEPPEDRGDVPRHFDPECISCHVTGWNPQEYYPYETGYVSLEESKHLLGSGCENCHGPGAEHSAAEEKGSTVPRDLRDQLRLGMQLPLEKAREKCMECHDLDNSIDFHEPDAFEDVYWPQVEHYGLE